MEKNNDFELNNLPESTRDPEITKEDFVLQQSDTTIHEQRFQTKPTTFFKDSLKRFSKNKSSVVAAYILGLLTLLAVSITIVDYAEGKDVDKPAKDNAFNYLEPRLFNGGSGFWDGTVEQSHVPVDTSSPNEEDWWPDETYFKRDGIINYKRGNQEFTNEISAYGRGGYLRVGYYGTFGHTSASIESFDSYELEPETKAVLDLSNTTLTLDVFDTVDANKIALYHDELSKSESGIPELPEELLPENFVLGNVSLVFNYKAVETEVYESIVLTDKKIVHNTGSTLSGLDHTEPIVISDIIKNNSVILQEGEDAGKHQTVFEHFYFSILVEGLEGTAPEQSVCTLIKALSIKATGNPTKNEKAYFEGDTFTRSILGVPYTTYIPGISFTEAMSFATRQSKISISNLKLKNTGYWSVENLTQFTKSIHLGRCTYASFTYDTYKGALGRRTGIEVSQEQLEKYAENGWVSDDYVIIPVKKGNVWVVDEASFIAPEIISDKCPILEEIHIEDITVKGSSQEYVIKCTVTYYRYLGYDKMPTFLFGTDSSGRDMFRYVFEGLFYSLGLGIITFIVCFLFGLLWGSVSGYFGGTVDLVMERFTDILSGIPWIVLMTIIILKAGQTFGTFVTALCLTGWIGTASTTRTQFYRFRGREYVLASRTLGASDARLISKHILPNAMGTIITGAVLMIPSVIFSEATISYLGLGFKGMPSLGVILSSNQAELLSHPYLLLFPAAVIALVMISFNLFGNGLRDAINPSLKGEDE